LFHLAGVPFNDHRYGITRKPEGGYEFSAEFQNDKNNGDFRVNMDRLPLLEVNGVRIGQSRSIERYLANKYGFFGKSDEDRALIDGVVENVRDIIDVWWKIYFAQEGEDKTKQIADWWSTAFPEWLKKLEQGLPENSSDVFVVGSTPSYADVVIWHLLRDTFTDKASAQAAETGANVARLTAIAEKVGNVEALRTYLAGRPEIPF
jgi:glutathione S-transferase